MVNFHEEDKYPTVDITESLQEKYLNWLKPNIVSVRIVQPGERVWLEITQEDESAGYLLDQIITRTDLGFISDRDKNKFFSPEDDVSINAMKFVHDFDPFSIINTTDLFHEDAINEVIDEKESDEADK